MILTVVTFAAVNVALLVLEPWLLRITRYDGNYTVARVVNLWDGPRPNILLMGSSRVYMGLDPAQMEADIARDEGVHVTALNMGVSSNVPDISYFMLKNLIDDDKKPDIIVYGAWDWDFASTKSIPRLPYTNLLLRAEDYAYFFDDPVESQIRFYADRLCIVCRDSDLFLNALDIMMNPYNVNHPVYLSASGPSRVVVDRVGLTNVLANGFVYAPGTLQMPEAALELFRHKKMPPFRIDPRSRDLFDRFVSLAKARNIQVVVLLTPVSSYYLGNWTGEGPDVYVQTVQQIAAAHGVPVVDAFTNADAIIPPNGYFDDLNHLNQVGAQALTRYVMETALRGLIRQRTDLPQSRWADLFQARLTGLGLPEQVAAGASITGSVRAYNVSERTWPTWEPTSVHVAYRWLDEQGSVVDGAGGRGELPGPMQPGDARDVVLTVEAPGVPGTYELRLDLVHDGIGWFADHGSAPLQHRVTVTAPDGP